MWKYFKVVVKVVFPVLFAYFSWMIKYSRHPEKYDLKLRFFKVQKIIRRILKAFNVSIRDFDLSEFNNVKEGDNNRFIICNHLSDADPLILIAYAKRPITFVAKKETMKFPFVGRIIKILNGEFIDREDLKMQLKIFKNVERKMKEIDNLDWIIFPEGTRNKQDVNKVQEFHYGTFKPAMRNGLDIYVLSLLGSQRILDKKYHDKCYVIPVKLVQVITSEDYKDKTTVDVSNEAHKACQNGVLSLVDEDLDLSLKFSKRN